MTFYSYRNGTSRGRDTYGYNIVSLTNTDTGKRYSTCGGGYDMFGTVLGEILNNEHAQAMLKLEKLAEGISRKGQGYESRREKGRMSPNHYAHYYGLTAYYGADGKPVKVYVDGATGSSNVKCIAQAIGLEVKEVYDKSPRRSTWKLLGVEITPLKGLDKHCAEQALYYGQTLAARARAEREQAVLCEKVTEADE